MDNERKPLGLDAFEMPSTPAPTIDAAPVVETPVVEQPTNVAPTIDTPVVDNVMPTIDPVQPMAPVVDNVVPTSEPVVDNVMPASEPVVDNAMPTSIPVIDSVMPETTNVTPVVDNGLTMNTMVNESTVQPNVEPTTYSEPMVDAMPVMENTTVDAPVVDNAMPMVDAPTVETPTVEQPVESFDYNFDFESQVNNTINYGNTEAPTPVVTPVQPEPMVDNTVAPESPVPIIMPEDNYEQNISSGDASNEGVLTGPGNQMTNTFNSYINDGDQVSNTMRTAEIVKEAKTQKDGKGGIVFLVILFLIIAAFIFILPQLIK